MNSIPLSPYRNMRKGRPTIEKVEHYDRHDDGNTCDSHDRSQIYP